MKKNFLRWVTVVTVSLIQTNNVISQFVAKDITGSEEPGFTNNVNPNGSGTIGKLNSAINPRAMRHFIHQFKKVEDPKWSVTETLYVAKFASNDIKSKVVYNKDGNWRYTVLQYKEKCLPGDIRKMVKSSYPDYTLTTIEEVHERNIVAYIVHLEDSKTVQIISICNGETKVWKAFNKSL